jgi:hypothetical protein
VSASDPDTMILLKLRQILVEHLHAQP